MRPFACRWLLAALCLTATACPPRPLRFGPQGEITDPAVLLRQLDAQRSRLQALRGDARIHVESGGRSGTADQFIAAHRPDALHLETLNFFGKPVAILVSEGGRFALFDAESGRFYRGPATAANLARLLPVTLSPQEAVEVLLGGVPRIAAQTSRLEIDEDARAYRLTLRDGEVVQQLWVGTEDLRPLRSEVRGAAAYDLRFEDYERYGEQLVPKRIRLRAVDRTGKRTGTEVEVRYGEIEVNPEPDPGLFEFAPPANSQVVELDALGNELPSEAPP